MSVASVGNIPVSPVTFSDPYRGQVIRQPDVAVDKPEKKVKPQEPVISSTAADLERVSLVFNKKLQFVVDHNSNNVVVKVIDKETDKVIKELPPEELQRLHSNLKETIGFLFDERV
ncbi:MAG: flagellar protein FlaG [Treponema sp.]|jgi:flagellar protein FlaG|nr:flagellar protein FlaG [Treponema sp.]